MPLIPAIERQRQVDVCEFKASLLYRASSWIVRATQRYPVWRKNKTKTAKIPNWTEGRGQKNQNLGYGGVEWEEISLSKQVY